MWSSILCVGPLCNDVMSYLLLLGVERPSQEPNIFSDGCEDQFWTNFTKTLIQIHKAKFEILNFPPYTIY